jgi:hypothetical protein
MSTKIKQEVLAKNLIDASSLKFSEAGASTVTISNEFHAVRKARLTLTNFSIAVTAALDYGGSKLLDLPDRNLMLLGMEVDCVVTKQGNTNGIVAATDLDMGIGTATASSTTLSSSMVNVIEKVDLDTNALAVDFEAHSSDQSTAVYPLKIADGASIALFMNVAAVGGVTADSSVTVTGTIDIFYVDLGNLSS